MERRVMFRGFGAWLTAWFGLGGKREARARSALESAPIIVFEGDWGKGRPDNLEHITTSAMDRLIVHMHPSEIASLPRLITVRRHKRGPMAVYSGEPGRAPAVILLSARDTYWAQYIYQFAHELGHVACNFRRVFNADNQFHWLEESICGAVALHCLHGMARDWPFPANHPFADYAHGLYDYFDERRQTYIGQDPVGDDPRGWYLRNAEGLYAVRGLEPINRPFAVWLFDRFQEDPRMISGMRYLNLWPNDESTTLSEHVLRWKRYTPAGRDALPNLLAQTFANVP